MAGSDGLPWSSPEVSILCGPEHSSRNTSLGFQNAELAWFSPVSGHSSFSFAAFSHLPETPGVPRAVFRPVLLATFVLSLIQWLRGSPSLPLSPLTLRGRSQFGVTAVCAQRASSLPLAQLSHFVVIVSFPPRQKELSLVCGCIPGS